MKARIAGLIGIVLVAAALLLPPPHIAIHSAPLLYAVAMYKAATGDTASALRLLQQAEWHAQASTRSACDAPL